MKYVATTGMANESAMAMLLLPCGRSPLIGPEVGRELEPGLSVFKSSAGSFRFVRESEGRVVAAVQVMSMDGEVGLIANVYTDPSARRRGYASECMAAATRFFKAVDYSEDVSPDGAALLNAINMDGVKADLIDVDGVMRPVKNSLGEPIAEDESGLRKFWRWMGESKLVDDAGRPLVFFHGTNQDFEVFSEEMLGMSTASSSSRRAFFATTSKDVAGLYADQAARVMIEGQAEHEAMIDRKLRQIEREENAGRWAAAEKLTQEVEELEASALAKGPSGQKVFALYVRAADLSVIEGPVATRVGEYVESAMGSSAQAVLMRSLVDDPIGSPVASDHIAVFSPLDFCRVDMVDRVQVGEVERPTIKPGRSASVSTPRPRF